MSLVPRYLLLFLPLSSTYFFGFALQQEEAIAAELLAAELSDVERDDGGSDAPPPASLTDPDLESDPTSFLDESAHSDDHQLHDEIQLAHEHIAISDRGLLSQQRGFDEASEDSFLETAEAAHARMQTEEAENVWTGEQVGADYGTVCKCDNGKAPVKMHTCTSAKPQKCTSCKPTFTMDAFDVCVALPGT